MARKDIYHDTVKHGLIKAGWTITHEFYALKYGGVGVEMDLGAERIITAQKGREKIAVEVKSFLRSSTISDFHVALGQFMSYNFVLSKEEPDRILYLAVPTDTYNNFFELEFGQEIIKHYHLKLIVYDIEQETIVTWID